MENRKYISPIAIDLGGKNTGVFMCHYGAGDDPAHGIKKASVLVMPDDKSKMTYSQIARTATRHRIRSNKRRKLAKRLLKQIIEQGLSLNPDEKQWQKLNGYLNRRGYNRIESEIDLSP